jgi:hypothetical protein
MMFFYIGYMILFKLFNGNFVKNNKLILATWFMMLETKYKTVFEVFGIFRYIWLLNWIGLKTFKIAHVKFNYNKCVDLIFMHFAIDCLIELEVKCNRDVKKRSRCIKKKNQIIAWINNHVISFNIMIIPKMTIKDKANEWEICTHELNKKAYEFY